MENVWENKKSALYLHPQTGIVFDSIAQLVEHNTFNVGVLGSSPSRVTKSDESLTFLFKIIGEIFLRDFSSDEIFLSYFFIRTINPIIESLID